jgi:hypothetical protein
MSYGRYRNRFGRRSAAAINAERRLEEEQRRYQQKQAERQAKAEWLVSAGIREPEPVTLRDEPELVDLPPFRREVRSPQSTVLA